MMHTNRKQKNIEIAKSVILVVLFLSTILLLYGFWWNVKPTEIDIDSLGIENENYDKFAVQEVIAPSVIEVSYGDGRFGIITKGTRNYWWNENGPSFTGAMKEFFASGNTFVESITKEQYQEVLSRESIKVVFDYNLPLVDTLEAYGIMQDSAVVNISNLSEVAYSFGSGESLFIYDDKEANYYRVVGEENFSESNSLLAIYIDLTEASYTAYPLALLVGEETKNMALVPLPAEFSYTISTYNNERSLGGREFEKALAETFFGETFDFTRVIEDAKGGVTYMYGYGERVFIAERNGSFRYNRENVFTKPISDLESLELALDFIAHHGASENSLGEKEDIRLFKIEKEDDKTAKTTFYFQIQKEDLILYEEEAAFIVECTGDTVTSFYRDFFLVETVQKQTLSAGEYTAINVLAKNYKEMAEILKKEGLIEYENEDAFQKVVDGIKAVRLVETRFGKTEEGIGKLETCWSFSFRDNGQTLDFYHSIRDALPMGYSLR